MGAIILGNEDSVTTSTIENLDNERYYTKVNLQTSGEAEVNWDNLTNTPFETGALPIKYITVTFDYSEGSKTIFTIPDNTIVLYYGYITTETFNDSGTDNLQFGTALAPSILINDFGMTAGIGNGSNSSLVVGTGNSYDLVATYVGENSDATAGAVTFYIAYIN